MKFNVGDYAQVVDSETRSLYRPFPFNTTIMKKGEIYRVNSTFINTYHWDGHSDRMNLSYPRFPFLKQEETDNVPMAFFEQVAPPKPIIRIGIAVVLAVISIGYLLKEKVITMQNVEMLLNTKGGLAFLIMGGSLLMSIMGLGVTKAVKIGALDLLSIFDKRKLARLELDDKQKKMEEDREEARRTASEKKQDRERKLAQEDEDRRLKLERQLAESLIAKFQPQPTMTVPTRYISPISTGSLVRFVKTPINRFVVNGREAVTGDVVKVVSVENGKIYHAANGLTLEVLPSEVEPHNILV